MIAQPDFDEPQAPTKSRHWLRWVFAGGLITPVILLVAAYSQRTIIADNLARDQLEKYGVRASYQIKNIGLRTQRLENVSLGDPGDPDFFAKSIELDLALNFGGVTLRDVRAAGVRLKGRYHDGKLSFGELDKFADPGSKEPINIPDIGLSLSNARIRLDTPWGRIGAGMSGEGLLRQRFEGRLALRAPNLHYQDCAARAVTFDGRFLFDFRRPGLIGPWTADALRCASAGYAAISPKIDGEMRLSEEYNNWFGDIKFTAQSVRGGDIALSAPRGFVSFDGKAERTNFDARLAGSGYDDGGLRIGNLRASAQGYANFGEGGMKISSRGDADIGGGVLANSYVGGIDAIARNAAQTPAAPLLKRIAPALRRAVSDFNGRLRYDASVGGGQATILFDAADLRTGSGLHIRQLSAGRVEQNAGRWALVSPLRIAAAGGDLPALRLAVAQGSGGQWSGSLVVDPYKANQASLAVPKLTFAGRPGGAWRFDGNASVTGPFPGGFVTGLKLPIDGGYDGRNFAFYQSCQNIAFDALRYDSLSLSRQNIRLCPDRGSILEIGGATKFSASLPSFAADGRYAGSRISARSGKVRFNLDSGFVADNVTAAWGDTPVRIETPMVRFSVKDGFAAHNIRVETGSADALTFFDIPQIDGRFTADGLRGKLGGANGLGASGQIANVPFNMSNASGDWSLIKGNLALQGAMRVSDTAQVDRFKPMDVPDILLTFEGGTINMLGNLHEPITGRQVAGLDISHIFASGKGRALVAVDDLMFDNQLQPEMLTPLTLGVIQNVAGAVYGDGMISWDTARDGVVSSGIFGTAGLDLAAGFGPVRGLKTEMKFTDLLMLETAPTQIARIDTINPGIAALDGIVRYRFLADQKVQIEGGSWPFAGGELSIQPTIWDLGVDTKRALILEVKGVEIAKFIETLDLSNLSATGIVDGTLPMEFDASGGQIVGGELITRPGGGNISYIGELSYKDLSAYANYAFGALRSIDYQGLRVGMRGNLAGEIITDISFDGIKQGKGAKQNFITRQLAKLPIKFNIRVEGPFFKLFDSARSFYDPGFLVEKNKPEILRRQRGGDGLKIQIEATPAIPSE